MGSAGDTVALRQARRDDLDSLRALETVCFGRFAWSERSLAAELEGVPSTRYVVVACDVPTGDIVGYGALLAVRTTADVQRIAVHPDRRRLGVGRLLLDALVTHAQGRGCTEALLEVADDNAGALALYVGAGFTEVARRPGYYAGQVDALVLRLVLLPARP